MGPRLSSVEVSQYRIPTDRPESDGTLTWNATEMVVVQVQAGGETGLGYTYAGSPAAALIHSKLAVELKDRDALDVPACWAAMRRSIRNLGRPGVCSMAIAAVDLALWDLKARLLQQPLAKLLGMCHDHVPIYGSGGFTSYTNVELQQQLSGWVEEGIAAVKMKIGREPDRDLDRVRAARSAIGPDAALYVDANGAYTRQQALWFAPRFADEGVCWFEEPVSSDDLDGLRAVRNRTPGGMEIAAGEYGYDLPYFRHMLEAQAVSVLQADITRCAGLSEFCRVAGLCAAFQEPLSAHTAPAAHLHPCCSLERLRNIEHFHDHVRIENQIFDGAPQPRAGALWPDLSRPGLGLELKLADARRYAA
ncbi:MAG: enolase C-terminal domain-like protein [Terriglobales bacterium]